MFSFFFQFLKKFQQDEGGAVLVYVALLMASLLGMAGIAVEVGSLYDTRQQMQTAADAAAFSSAIAQCSGQTNGGNVVTEGRAAAASSGSVNDVNSAVTINLYTAAGMNQGTEAVIGRTEAGTLARIFNINTWNLGARGAAGCPEINFCMLSLASTGTGLSVGGGGGGAIGNPACGIYVNSASVLQGNAKIAGPLTAAGDIQEIGNSVAYLYHKAPFPSENTGEIKLDPYSSLNLQSVVDSAVALISPTGAALASGQLPANYNPGNCTANDIPNSTGGNSSLSSGGNYCTARGPATLSGTTSYVLKDMAMSGNLTLNGANAGVYPTNAAVASSGTLSLDAAKLIFKSGGLNSSTKINLSNNSLLVVYGNLTLKSGSVLNVANSTLIVFGNIDFQGGTTSTFTSSKLIMCPSGCTTGGTKSLTIGANSTVTFNSTTVFDYQDLSISGGANVTFKGPTSGLSGGLALVNLSQTDYTWDLGGNVALTGALYYPNGTVRFSGNAQSSCGQVIAKRITTQGTPSVNLFNDGSCGLANLTDSGPVRMVE